MLLVSVLGRDISEHYLIKKHLIFFILGVYSLASEASEGVESVSILTTIVLHICNHA